jgi:hypothetical protein
LNDSPFRDAEYGIYRIVSSPLKGAQLLVELIVFTGFLIKTNRTPLYFV